jgi:hypothetical protein
MLPITSAPAIYQETTNTFVVEMTPQGPGATVSVAQDSFSGAVFSSTYLGIVQPFDCGVIFFNHICNERIPETLLYQVIPDGAGGVLTTLTYRSQDATQLDQDSLIRVVDGGVAYTIPPPGLASGTSVGGAGIALTDDDAAILSPFQALNVAKFDTVSGAVLWSTPQATNGDNIYVQNATDDGGVMLQDVAYGPDGMPTTTLMQLDPNGTETASTSLAKDLSLLNTLYLAAGNLLLQDPNTSALQDMPLPSFPASPGLVFPIIGIGNNFKMKAANGISVKQFVGANEKGCTGYDDKYKALMVPQIPNSNTLWINAKKGHNVTLVPIPDNAVTFSPSAVIPGDGHDHQLTVSGAANTYGTFQVTAHSDDGTLLGPAFRVDVKPLRNINSVTIFSLVAPGLVPPNVPTQSSLLKELNRIYPRQTNVTFTNVVAGGNFNFSYDKNTDGAMYYDANAKGVGCFPFPASSLCRTSTSELGPLLDSFYEPSGQHNQGDANDFQVMYVNKISKEGVGGYSVAGDPTLPAIVRTDVGTRSVVGNYRENQTAHEIGHILGVGASFTINGQVVGSIHHNNRGSDYLMWYNNYASAPCKISRDDWNLINFTQGTMILDVDGKAH